MTLVLTRCAEPSLTSTKASVTSFGFTSLDTHDSISGRLDAAFISSSNWPWRNVLKHDIYDNAEWNSKPGNIMITHSQHCRPIRLSCFPYLCFCRSYLSKTKKIEEHILILDVWNLPALIQAMNGIINSHYYILPVSSSWGCFLKWVQYICGADFVLSRRIEYNNSHHR